MNPTTKPNLEEVTSDDDIDVEQEHCTNTRHLVNNFVSEKQGLSPRQIILLHLYNMHSINKFGKSRKECTHFVGTTIFFHFNIVTTKEPL